LVYPLARGSGPLLSFFLAVLLLKEPMSWMSVMGVLLVVAGILMVSGILQKQHRAPLPGILYGLGTGCFIAAYTVNDGWAVKVLLISPVIIDYFGNFVRMLVLAPKALARRAEVQEEFRLYLRPAMAVAVLGPFGYILVLYAMQVAPISHVAPARELATLLGTFIGARLFKERAAPSRILGAICIVAGVISLTLTDI
jgi:drug/metabolite transporter (DMT)-like permease